MTMIFTMVTEKKVSGSRGTLTRTEVMMKTNMMMSKLPITRRRWLILIRTREEERGGTDTSVGIMNTTLCAMSPGVCHSTHIVCKKELRQVQISRGNIAHSVITLLNLASRTLRRSPAASVWLVEESTGGSFRRLVKYYRERERKFFINYKSFILYFFLMVSES